MDSNERFGPKSVRSVNRHVQKWFQRRKSENSIESQVRNTRLAIRFDCSLNRQLNGITWQFRGDARRSRWLRILLQRTYLNFSHFQRSPLVTMKIRIYDWFATCENDENARGTSVIPASVNNFPDKSQMQYIGIERLLDTCSAACHPFNLFGALPSKRYQFTNGIKCSNDGRAMK